jgi:hypothetical protein
MAPIDGEPIRGEREGSAVKVACRMEEGAAAEARPPSASKPYERMFGIVKDFISDPKGVELGRDGVRAVKHRPLYSGQVI